MSIKRIIKRHKAVVAAVLLCVALACCGGAIFYLQTQTNNSIEQEQEHDATAMQDSEAAETQENQDEDQQGSKNPTEALSNEDKNRYKDEIDSYSSTTRELQDLLNASVWVNGEAYARFSDGAVTYRKSSGNSVTEPFVIKAVETSTSTEDSSKSQMTTYIAAVELDGDSGLLTYKRSASTAVDYDLSASTISCSLIFGNTQTFNAQAQSQSFTVANFNSDALLLLGGDSEKIRQPLAKWCAEQAPTATTASWDETLNVDYTTQLVKAPMTLDNSSKTKVTIIYDMVGGTITIKSGSSN